ncbi:MAG TPA: cupin domain-containing protein [Crocinitomicaceae bacterium]|nr:cupin domain-containing protein [Crocinitomicaceae bacterium]
MLIKNAKNQLDYDGLKTSLLVSNETGKVILISLEKGAILKKHVSDTDANILIEEGEIIFEINDEKHNMVEGDMYSFKKNEVHELTAVENSKVILTK